MINVFLEGYSILSDMNLSFSLIVKYLALSHLVLKQIDPKKIMWLEF
jgi:hypothetical protein